MTTKYKQPTAENENGPSVKTCRFCGKKFIAQKAYYICCSWACQTAHKAAMDEPITGYDAPDKQEHPF